MNSQVQPHAADKTAFRCGWFGALIFAAAVAVPGFHSATLSSFGSAFRFFLLALTCLPVALTACLIGVAGRDLAGSKLLQRQAIASVAAFSVCYCLAAFAVFLAFHPFWAGALDLLPRMQPIRIDDELHYGSAYSIFDLISDALTVFSVVGLWAAGAVVACALPNSLVPRPFDSKAIAVVPILLVPVLFILLLLLKLLPWLILGRSLSESGEGRNIWAWFNAVENCLIFVGVAAGLGFFYRRFSVPPTVLGSRSLWRAVSSGVVGFFVIVVLAPIATGREADSNFFGLRIAADITVNGETAHIKGGALCKGHWDGSDRYWFEPNQEQEVWFAARTASGRLVRLSFEPLCYAAYKTRPGELSDGVTFSFREETREFAAATSIIIEQKGSYDVRARANNPEDFAKRGLDVSIADLNVQLVPPAALRDLPKAVGNSPGL